MRTGSTIVFILIIVLYFYGFRTGFVIERSDILDIALDIFIIIFSAILIINEYTMRGITDEIKKSDNTYLNDLVSEHKKLLENMDDDLVHENLLYWNLKEDKKVMEDKKREIVEKYKRKRRNTKVGSRKYKKITKRIEKYQDPNTIVKAKRKPTKLGNVKKQGPMRKENEKEIREFYSPQKDTVRSQSGLAVLVAVLTPMLRFALEPTWQALGEAFMFLAFLIPFLIFRAVLAYQISRNNTKDKYPEAVAYRIKIIKWCQNYNKGEYSE